MAFPRYNGLPPDNAGKFKKWLQTQKPNSLHLDGNVALI